MPFLDVTDLLADPDIAGEPFTVIRRSEGSYDHGRPVIETTTLPAMGSITPTGDNSLVRAEGYETSAKTILVVTTFPLRGSSQDDTDLQWHPDIVKWKGDYFVVRSLDDYSQYGAGLVAAECTATPYQELPTA